MIIPPIQMAVIGDFRQNDFRNVIRNIREKTTAIYFDNLALFLQTDGLTQNYDLVFLLASSFAQYSPNDLRQLQTRLPLARIVMISGSLTEGERRTGWLPPGLIRYYWHQWETEVLPVFTAFCDRRPSPWGLPLTASDEERLLITATSNGRTKLPSGKQPQKAVIIADDPAMRELLVDWVTQQGFQAETRRCPNLQSVFEPPTETTEILLDVITENLTETIATVQFLKKHHSLSARITVFYNSPRPDETEQLTQAGADRVVAKPFFLPDGDFPLGKTAKTSHPF